MGRFKNALKIVGDVIEAKAEQDRKVRELTKTLLNKTYGVDYDQAEKIARVLINQAEVTWK